MDIEYIRNRWDYDPDLGVLIQKAAGQGTVAGRVVKSDTVSVKGKAIRVYRVMWALQTGEQPPESIDHIDGNRRNNKWNNLRAATAREQAYNKVPPSGGCYFRNDYARTKPWRARIRLPNGQRKIVGDYATKAEGEEAYRQEALKLHGEFYYGNPR